MNAATQRVPKVLRSGDWVPIGFRSELRYSNGKLQHRVEGKVYNRSADWLGTLPLLLYVLNKVP
jgi:hypothetical protein